MRYQTLSIFILSITLNSIHLSPEHYCCEQNIKTYPSFSWTRNEITSIFVPSRTFNGIQRCPKHDIVLRTFLSWHSISIQFTIHQFLNPTNHGNPLWAKYASMQWWKTIKWTSIFRETGSKLQCTVALHTTRNITFRISHFVYIDIIHIDVDNLLQWWETLAAFHNSII